MVPRWLVGVLGTVLGVVFAANFAAMFLVPEYDGSLIGVVIMALLGALIAVGEDPEAVVPVLDDEKFLAAVERVEDEVEGAEYLQYLTDEDLAELRRLGWVDPRE